MQTRLFPPHFTRRELECHCGCGLCNPTDELLSLAEKVRHVLADVPMVVNSCCRCKAHNTRVGGSPTSKHLTGRALDFVPKRVPIREAYLKIVGAWLAKQLPELGGIGIYDTFLHIDTAKAADGHLRTWDSRSTPAVVRAIYRNVKIPADLYAEMEERGLTFEGLIRQALKE